MTRQAVRRVLVTGANGFVGVHLTRELSAHGISVVAAGLDADPTLPGEVGDYVCADLTTAWPALPEVDGVVHLAGLSAVGPSFDDPQAYLETNGALMLRLAEWAVAQSRPVRAVVVSSGAVYDAMAPAPLTEDSPVASTSPYVVSKLLVEQLADHYRRRGLDVVVARPFNHIGPGQGPGFLVPDLARQLVGSGPDPTIRVGDLGTARDYTDVRDVVRAYRLLLVADAGAEWTFNVCSSRARTGRDLLGLLTEAVGHPAVRVEVDPSRVRPHDPAEVRGSAERLRRLTGWRPEIPVERSVADFASELLSRSAS